MSCYQTLCGSRIRLAPGTDLRAPQEPSWWEGLASRAPDYLRTMFADGFLLPWFYDDLDLIESLTFMYLPRGSNPRAEGTSIFGMQRATDGSYSCPILGGSGWIDWTSSDYWFAFNCRTRPFWEGLHGAGTRGDFLFEFHSESGYEKNGFDFDLPGRGAEYLISVCLSDSEGIIAREVECDRTWVREYQRKARACQRLRDRGEEGDEPLFTGILERWGDRAFDLARRSRDQSSLEMHGFDSDTRV